MKHCSYFVEQEKLEEENVESVVSKVFSTLYWLAKEESSCKILIVVGTVGEPWPGRNKAISH